MRCLYCGKTLPLLKRLTGGGEFCSEAHRIKYQEEYNKLALSRLLQAQAPGSEAPAAGGTAQNGSRGPMRALPAPMPRPGQRALPPPGALPAPMPRPGSRALPAPAAIPPGEVRATFPVPAAGRTPATTPAAATEAAPPPFVERPKPQPDPPLAFFRMEIPKAKAPEGKAVAPTLVSADAEWLAGAAWRPASSGLAALPGDWDALVETPEPDPPEAPAWDHPMTIRSAPEVRKPVMAEMEEFGRVPLMPVRVTAEIGPVQPPRRIGERLPMPVDFATGAGAKLGAMAAPGSWDLRVGLPDWRPRFKTVLAPVMPLAAQPAAGRQVAEEPVAVVPEPVAAAVQPPAVAEPKAHEVSTDGGIFIDLSLLGMLEEKPASRRR